MSEHEEIIPHGKETVSGPTTITMPIDARDPILSGIIEKVCLSVTDKNLGNLQVLSPDPKVKFQHNLRVRDFAPRVVQDGDKSEDKTSKEMIFFSFFVQNSYDVFIRSLIEGKNSDEVEEVVYDNIEISIDALSKNPRIYNALVDHLHLPSELTASELISSLTRSNGVVDLVRFQDISRLVDKEIDDAPVFQNSVFRSNNSILQQNRMARIKSEFSSLFGVSFQQINDEDKKIFIPDVDFGLEEEDYEHNLNEDKIITLQKELIEPLLEAVSGEAPNKLAVFNLVNFYRELNNLIRTSGAVPSDFFTTTEANNFFRSFEEKVIRICMISSDRQLYLQVFDFFHEFSFSPEGKMNFFIAVGDTLLETGEINSKLKDWVDVAYPESSSDKDEVLKLFVDPNPKQVFRGLVYSTLEYLSEKFQSKDEMHADPQDVEYWINRTLDYLGELTEADYLFLKDMLKSGAFPMLNGLKVQFMLMKYKENK